MKQLKKTLKNRSGFTLGEVLICVLILLLITAVVAGALPVARDAYYRVVDSANAQVLLSTTIAALRDELSTAGHVSVEGRVITYHSASSGSDATLSVVEDAAGGRYGFVLRQYANSELGPDPGSDGTRLLVSQKAATGDLYPWCESISYDENSGIVTFTNLSVKKPGVEQPLASAGGEFYIRVIDPT